MSIRVCVLSEIEADAFEFKYHHPDCSEHDHIDKDLADEWCAGKNTPKKLTAYKETIGKWVGPKQIRFLGTSGWRVVNQTRKGGSKPTQPNWAFIPEGR